MIEDPRFVDAAARLEHRDELRALMDAAYPRFTTQQLCLRFEEDALLTHKHSSRRTGGSSGESDGCYLLPASLRRIGRTPRPAAQFEQTPSNLYAHTPQLGEHSREVLGELGYEKSDVDRLLAQQIILETTDG